MTLWLSLAECSRRLGADEKGRPVRSTRALLDDVKAGVFPGRYFGNKVRVRAEEFQAFVEGTWKKPEPEADSKVARRRIGGEVRS